MGTNILKSYRETNHRLISFIIYLILGIPILAAGLIKFINPSDFASSLKYSFYLSDWLSIVIAIIIPVTEIVIGVSLLFNLYRYISIITYRLLLICFLVFHIWNNFISAQKPCNCFGNLIEFNGIWMMVIIIALLMISIIPMKFKAEKVSNDPVNKRFSKKEIILVAGVLVLFITVGYVRWLRIDRELGTGLISHIELPEVKARLNSIFNSYFSDLKDNKHTLLLFLRGKSCVSCLEELEFWKKAEIHNDVNIVDVFISISEDDKKWFNEILKIPFEMRSLKKEIFLEMIGRYPAIINRFFLTSNRQLILAKATSADNNEKRDFFMQIKNITN